MNYQGHQVEVWPVLKGLLQRGANPHCLDGTGRTPEDCLIEHAISFSHEALSDWPTKFRTLVREHATRRYQENRYERPDLKKIAEKASKFAFDYILLQDESVDIFCQEQSIHNALLSMALHTQTSNSIYTLMDGCMKLGIHPRDLLSTKQLESIQEYLQRYLQDENREDTLEYFTK